MITWVSAILRGTVWGDDRRDHQNLNPGDVFGCPNANRCHLKQSFSGIHSHLDESQFNYSWHDSWVQINLLCFPHVLHKPSVRNRLLFTFSQWSFTPIVSHKITSYYYGWRQWLAFCNNSGTQNIKGAADHNYFSATFPRAWTWA